MEKEIQQLVEMGATVAQARAALNKYKDVMQAAERIFDGSFDHVLDDDGDVEMASGEPAPPQRQPRMITPDDDEDISDAAEEDDEDDEEDFADYDSDVGVRMGPGTGTA